MENAEINNIIKIVGLQYKKDYEDQESLKTLRYGKIMIMTDQVRFTEIKNRCLKIKVISPPFSYCCRGTQFSVCVSCSNLYFS